MSGPPHTFQTSFANAQQAAMRTQFVGAGGPQIPGLMTPTQQAGMVPQQGYGVVGMQQPVTQQTQQMQLQQQQLQMQQQQLQQMQQQQQQQQQQQDVGGAVPTSAPQPAKEYFNTASLCRYGQETVQDIVTRTHEIFSTLKIMQPPNGTPQGSNASNEKKAKMQELLKTIRLLFKRLRVIYEKCNEGCLQGMEYMHIESLIPLREEWDMKFEERKTSEQYRLSCEENKKVMEQVVMKNRQLKEVIDNLRRIIWEINTMLTMRRS